MRRSAKVERSKRVPLLQPGPDLDTNFARRHFSESNRNEAHQADDRIVRFNEDECARGDVGNEVL